MTRMRLVLFMLAALVAAVPAPLASAQGNAVPSSLRGEQGKDIPTHITADRLTYSQDRDSVVFEGHVHVTRGEMQLWSDRLTAYLEPSEPEPAKGKQAVEPPAAPQSPLGGKKDAKIKSVVAVGNVRMQQQGRQGFCGKATFHVEEGLLVMEDNPVILDGRNKVTGEVIKFYTQTNRSEVLGGKKQVEATFFTKQESLSPTAKPSGDSKAPDAAKPADGAAPEKQ
ncbi:OstA family protein [Desulfovibrio sp. X2]|uniref:LptA/OstA family protein n=1 Tax=Desulfovibrio sp. X2 TaxID=941449 RepID=UPI000358798D|nr:LptA/OstA family protein [Desulfovibrio sp. X2]EPR42197.1 OstA family protein [Desulfovibrio sp. X2]